VTRDDGATVDEATDSDLVLPAAADPLGGARQELAEQLV
jgi:hypothetical protein